MTLPVYIGYDKFRHVGILTILSDRIIHADISYTFTNPIGTAERFALYNNQKELFPNTTLSMQQDTQSSFTIKKISKADFAFRNAGLTHEIISNDLKKRFDDTKFYIQPSFIQRLTLTNNLKKFFWQAQDFKIHIYKYVATSFVSLAIGIIGTLLVVKPWNKTNTTTPVTDTLSKQPVTPIIGDTITHQPIHKIKTP